MSEKITAAIGDKQIIIESGKLAKQADGAVTVQLGDTIVVVAAVAATKAKEGQDFFPLTVDYREKAAAAGKRAEECRACHGTGELRQSQRTPFGQFVNVTTCPHCRGEGHTVPDPCKACGGVGRVRGARSVRVTIPAGVDTGQRLRLTGEGETGERGGLRGDLYIFLTVAAHNFFRRDGLDVYCEVPVSFIQAALGDEISLPTLNCPEKNTCFEKLRIPAGAQTGTVFRMQGKGFPAINSRQRGDMYVAVKVAIPQQLSGKQKQLLEEFASVSGEELHKPQKPFFDRIKHLFHIP